MSRTRWLPGIALVLGLSPLSAKDLFVATTGSDAVSYAANSLATPWATPAKAWAEARAGDTVYFRGGTYPVTQMIDTRSTGFDGTADAPVTFTCYGDEVVVIDGDIANTPGNSRLLRIQRSHHHIHRLTLRARIPERGSVIQVGYDNPHSEHVRITHCTIELVSVGIYDNAACISLQTDIANFVEISNCRLIGTGVLGPNNVGANGVIAFRTQGARIFNNDFSRLYHGVYWKHSNALDADPTLQIQIRNNVFRELQGSGVYGNPNHALIQNNLMIACRGGISMGDDGGPGDGYVGADYNTIRNNTMYQCTLGFSYEGRPPEEDPNRGCLHNVIENNVFMGPMRLHSYDTPRDASGVPIPDYDYDVRSNWNLYPDQPDLFTENRTNYSLAQWRTINGTDAQSLTGQPVFMGGAAPTTLAGFALAAGSPGKNAGSDGKDMGADVSQVGIKPLATLTLTSPNGGESWRRGESRAITWTAVSVTENLVIELMQGATLLGVIATGIAPSSGSYTWTVGRLLDGTFRTGASLKLRIRTATGAVLDIRGME